MAHVWKPPAARLWGNELMPLTSTAVNALLVSSLPSCPEPPFPQHETPPVESFPMHACPAPHTRVAAPFTPCTSTAVALSATDGSPLPSWPALLSPQHHTVLFASLPTRAQEKSSPTQMAFAGP